MNKRFESLLGIQENAIIQATEILDNPTQCQSIPLNQWIPIADLVHEFPNFLTHLLKHLTEEEKQALLLSLAMSNACEGNPSLFWKTLHQESKSAYGKAIVSAARVYDFLIVAKELAAVLPSSSPAPTGLYQGSN